MKLNDTTNSARFRNLKSSNMNTSASSSVSMGVDVTGNAKNSLNGGINNVNNVDNSISFATSFCTIFNPNFFISKTTDFCNSCFITENDDEDPLSNYNSLYYRRTFLDNPSFEVLSIGVIPSSGADDKQYCFVTSGVIGLTGSIARTDNKGAIMGLSFSVDDILIGASPWIYSTASFSSGWEGYVNSKVSVADAVDSFTTSSNIILQSVENNENLNRNKFKVIGDSPYTDINFFSGIVNGKNINCNFYPYGLSHSYIGGNRSTEESEFNSYNMSHLTTYPNLPPPLEIENVTFFSLTRTSGQEFDAFGFTHSGYYNYKFKLGNGNNQSYSDFLFTMDSNLKFEVIIPIYNSNSYYFDFLVNGICKKADDFFSTTKKIRFGISNSPLSDPLVFTQSIYGFESISSDNYITIGAFIGKNSEFDFLRITATPDFTYVDAFSLVFKGTVINTPCIWDYDVHNFIVSSGITDEQEIFALCQLVSDLKSKFIWDRLIAFYPFLGGSASTHSVNLKDPSQYSITFNEMSHSNLGIQTDNTDSFGNTGYVPFSSGYLSIGVYANIQTAFTENGLIGVTDGFTHSLSISQNSSIITYLNLGNTASHSITQSLISDSGFYAHTRISDSEFIGIVEGKIFKNNSTQSGSYPNSAIYIGSINNNNLPLSESIQIISTAYISNYIDEQQLIYLDDIVRRFNSKLGRS